MIASAPQRKKGKVKLRYLIAVVIGLIGVSVLVYPTLRSWLYDQQTAYLKQAFLERAVLVSDAASPDRDDALYQLLKSENERFHLTGQSGLVDAFSYQTAGIDLSAHGIEDNRIGFVSVPAIKAELPIYLGANQDNLSKGATHLTETSYPIGGPNTNAVIAAHRGVTVEMFRNIHKIQVGDQIIITNFREQLVYQAVEIRIIHPNEIDHIKIQDGRDLITLLSCDPIGYDYQRYVLIAERI